MGRQIVMPNIETLPAVNSTVASQSMLIKKNEFAAQRAAAPSVLRAGICHESLAGNPASFHYDVFAGATTAMLKNIPNKCTQAMLINKLHGEGFKCDIDFMYLPVDFKQGVNMGYAFLNFRTSAAAARFASAYDMTNCLEKSPET